MDKTIIIAEIGECFNGEMKMAHRLILLAKNAGCDIVKFQTLDYENISEGDPEKEWLSKVALDPEKIKYLIGWAKKVNIRIMFTPENIKTSQWLLDAGLRDVKIGSSSIVDIKLIKFINKYFKRVFMSTGMASLVEIKKAVSVLNNIKDLYIMHCISEYPTGPLLEHRGLKALSNADVRLSMMKMLMKIYPQYKVGYSDHTVGILAPVAAVASGAKVIEKHITLNRKIPVKNFMEGRKYLGTDHVLSLEYHELKEMVKQIRELAKIFGPLRWQRSKGERNLKKFLRKRFINKAS